MHFIRPFTTHIDKEKIHLKSQGIQSSAKYIEDISDDQNIPGASPKTNAKKKTKAIDQSVILREISICDEPRTLLKIA